MKKKENKNSQILDLTVNNQKRALFPRVHVLNLSAYWRVRHIKFGLTLEMLFNISNNFDLFAGELYFRSNCLPDSVFNKKQ